MICRRIFQLPSISIFLVAMVTGMLLCAVIQDVSWQYLSDSVAFWTGVSHDKLYRRWLKNNAVERILGDEKQYAGSDHKVITESRYLLQQTKILCVVMLDDDNTKWQKDIYLTSSFLPTMSSAEYAIMHTWGRHCSGIVFFARRPSLDIVTVQLPGVTDIHSWMAYYDMLMHISKVYIDEYKWFAIVEEDTFLIVENLAYYVAVYNHSTPFYAGHVLTSWGREYNMGGPGIIINRAALQKLYQHLAKGHCSPAMDAGDFLLAQCLRSSGIIPIDSRDSLARSRFLMYQPELHLVPGVLQQLASLWPSY